MLSEAVIEDFDVVEDIASAGCIIEETLSFNGSAFVATIERLHSGAVVAVAIVAHALEHNVVSLTDLFQASTDKYHDFRDYACRVALEVFKSRNEVTVLPFGFASRIKKIYSMDGDLEEAFAPQSVLILLYDEIDISRGDLIVKPNNKPKVGQDIEAVIC